MGTALLKIKIMPTSPDVELDDIENKAKQVIEENEGRGTKTEREDVAFGIVAVIVTFAIDESLETDPFLDNIRKIDNVSSAETIDFRRALG
jgi:elongation factor 1-beta